MAEFVLNLNVENSQDFSHSKEVIKTHKMERKSHRTAPTPTSRAVERKHSPTRQPRMKQEVEKRSTSGSRVVSAKDFPGGATHDDLVPYLPRSGIPSNYARPMNVCT